MIRRLRPGRGGLLGAARPRTPRELVATLGRVVLWLALGVVLIRGLAGTLATERPAAVPRLSRGAPNSAWPDDAARSFAVDFASAYLTHSPTEKPGAYAARLEAYASPELVGDLAPRFGDRSAKEVVRSAAVAGAVRLDDGHALVTVAATVEGPTMTRRRLTVPIARDTRGGLAVYDLPSFVSGPARAAASPTAGEPLVGGERAAIVDVLARFVRAYLAGDSAALAYLVPPGTRLAAAAGRWQLLELTSVSATGPATRAGRLVMASVQARDLRSRATYALRYRVRLVRRERWYVAEVNGPGGGERR